MGFETEIVSYLGSAKNIEMTLEIGERLEDVKNCLRHSFWKEARPIAEGDPWM